MGTWSPTTPRSSLQVRSGSSPVSVTFRETDVEDRIYSKQIQTAYSDDGAVKGNV